MKVLMFGWEFPPHISGGLGTACYGLTKGLLHQGVEVLFVLPKAHGDEDKSVARIINASDVIIDIKDLKYKDIWKKLTFLEIGSHMVPYLSPEEFNRLTDVAEHDRTDVEESVFSQRFEFSGKYGKDLFQEVSRYTLVAVKTAMDQTFDVIHAHDWLTFSAGIAVKEITGKPLIAHVHATEFDRSGEHVNQMIYDIEKKGMEAADKVIAVSNLTRQIIIERYGIDPEKVVTIHNGVMPKEETPKQYQKHVKEKVVTFLGRVTFQKGPDYFVEAAYKVLQKDKNVRFVMAGSGDMMNKMIRRVAQLKIATNFHFTGFLKGEDVDRMFGMSDVYVMPSVSEPFGISPLEAMRSNVPVIISRQSGVSEVLIHALKVNFWDVDAMADAMYGLLHYSALSKMFIHYGKAEVENLKWDNAAENIRDLYQYVLKK